MQTQLVEIVDDLTYGVASGGRRIISVPGNRHSDDQLQYGLAFTGLQIFCWQICSGILGLRLLKFLPNHFEVAQQAVDFLFENGLSRGRDRRRPIEERLEIVVQRLPVSNILAVFHHEAFQFVRKADVIALRPSQEDTRIHRIVKLPPILCADGQITNLRVFRHKRRNALERLQ